MICLQRVMGRKDNPYHQVQGKMKPKNVKAQRILKTTEIEKENT